MTAAAAVATSLFGDLFERLPVAVYLVRPEDPDDAGSFRLIAANPAARLRSGQNIGQTLAQAVPGAMDSELPQTCLAAIRTGKTQELELACRDPLLPERRFHVRAVPLGGNTLAVLADDVTARFAQSERLRMEQALMSRAQKAARIGTFRWHAPENRLSWSEEMPDLLGIGAAEFNGTMEAFLAIVHPDDRDALGSSFVHTARTREPLRVRSRMVRRDGEIRWIETSAVADIDDDSTVTGLHGVCVDVSETMRTEFDQPREDSTRLLVSRIRDYAIFMLDTDGRVISWNEGAQRMKGYTAAEIIGRYFGQFYEQERQEAGDPAQLLKVAAAQGRVEEEAWRVRKDGSRFCAGVVITALFDDEGRLRGFGKVTRDLTERKEIETALADLAGRLLQNQDEERRRIARELHDSTSPLLAGITTRLYGARGRIPPTDRVLERLIAESVTNAEAVATVIRTVSALLHPPLLDDSGLLPSLRWYLNALSGRTGIRVDTQFPASLPRLSQEIETAAFRLVQECLTTIARQAATTAAHVAVLTKDRFMTVQIMLDGQLSPVAFHGLRTGQTEGGIGLAGLRERIRQLEGELEVKPGTNGTTVAATLPLTPR